MMAATELACRALAVASNSVGRHRGAGAMRRAAVLIRPLSRSIVTISSSSSSSSSANVHEVATQIGALRVRPRDAGTLFGELPQAEIKKDLGAVSPALSGSFYQRYLPEAQVPFSSPEGRRLFAEALAAGHMENYFHLAEQFRTQDEPTFCGLTTLTMALNALRVDPMRTWKGAWRWYSESMLASCCYGIDLVRSEGLTYDMFRSLAICHGAQVEDHRSPALSDSKQLRADFANRFRESVKAVCRSQDRECLIISYSRNRLGQSGAGHFSPIGGYHAESDSVLILDVARFKYPPHWAPLEDVVDAMASVDDETNKPRGHLLLRLRGQVEPAVKSGLQPPLYIPFIPVAAGRPLAEALEFQLAAQCNGFSEHWESWSIVAMRRWLMAASSAEPQVLKQLLQVADSVVLGEVLRRLDGLDVYKDLCGAYAEIVLTSDLPAEFPPLRYTGESTEITDGLSLDTCGELWVLLLLLLPAHLRTAVAAEIGGSELPTLVARTVRGPWALPMEALRASLASVLTTSQPKTCRSSSDSPLRR